MIFTKKPDISGMAPAAAVQALQRHIVYMQERLEVVDAEYRKKLADVQNQQLDIYHFEENLSLKEACLRLGFLTEEAFDHVFHPEEMA